MSNLYYQLLFFVSLFIISCSTTESVNNALKSSKKLNDNSVTIHETGDPDRINPILARVATASNIAPSIFQSLIGRDPVSYDPYPVLVKEVPSEKIVNEGPYSGGISYSFEIRPEAVWDDGSPITAYDYAFTIKTIKNPKVDCGHLRPYVEFIKEIDIDPEHPKKFKVILEKPYILALDLTSYYVIPEYIYDSDRIMRQFSLKQLEEETETLRNNPEIIKFAENFNSDFHSREKEGISGSGPYSFMEWKTGQYVELEKKKNWWGERVESPYFNNGPDKIIHTIIKDWSTAISALKDEKIDIARSIRAKDFVDLSSNEKVKELYSLHAPDYMAYDYIGMHLRNPKFSDKRVRKAFNHLIDKTLIRDVIMYGYAVDQLSPVHPSKPYYNKDLIPYEFDINKAKSLLSDAGWKDTDGDGLLDKVVDGVSIPFKIILNYNAGNTRRENIAMILKENALKAGIEIEVQALEIVVLVQNVRAHNYEMLILGTTVSPLLDDFKQRWHSEGYNTGANITGFGDAKTDKLIEDIRVNMDPTSRTTQYKEFQAILHEEVPVIFLLGHKNKMAFHRRFENAKGYIPSPGYDVTEWKLREIRATSDYHE